MVKVREQPYKRGRENYHMSPEEKADIWREIQQAAQVIIDKGGADIKFTAVLEDSERYYREKNKREQLWLREMNSRS